MCRSIRPLFNFEPPASAEEIEAAALQFVRKVSGTRRPSRANQPAFEGAVAEIAAACQRLLAGLHTQASPRSREAEAERARVRRARDQGRRGFAAPRVAR